MTDRSKATTHATDCWSWGPAHYECAVREIERLRKMHEDAYQQGLEAGFRIQEVKRQDDARLARAGGRAMIPLKIKRLHPDAIIPRYATTGAACLDLHSIDADTLEPGMACEFRTGLAVELPANHVMLVYSRSGNGFRYGVRLANCTGIIDSDYRGEIVVKLRNDGAVPLAINRGDRIAQAMVLPVPKVQIVEVDELTSTERGAGGFGSTGDGG